MPVADPPTRIVPKLPGGGEQHLTNLLAAELNEAQLVWSRYNAMLTANAVLAAVLAVFLTQAPEQPSGWLRVLCGAILGVILGIQWFLLTRKGWRFSVAICNEIADLAGHARDPLDSFYRLYGKRDPLHDLAHSVIVTFIAAYAFVAVYAWVHVDDAPRAATPPPVSQLRAR